MQREINLKLISFERNCCNKNRTKYANCFLNCMFVTSLQ